jgi:hypothetical protein
MVKLLFWKINESLREGLGQRFIQRISEQIYLKETL